MILRKVFLLVIMGNLWLSATSTVCCSFDGMTNDVSFFDGKLYVLRSHHVYEIGSDGTVIRSIGSFKRAVSLAVGKQGIYVADSKQYRIFVFDNLGDLRASWGSRGRGNSEFRGFAGIGADDAGKVYVADKYAKVVKVFDSDGRFVMQFKAGKTTLSDLALDDDFVYVSDVLGNITVYDKEEGTLSRTIGPKNGKYAGVSALAADGEGAIYAGYTNDCILHLDASEHIKQAWGKRCGGRLDFSGILGIAPTRKKLYVSDRNYHGVVAIDLSGDEHAGNKTTISGLKTAFNGEFVWSKPVSNIKITNGLFWQDNPINTQRGYSYRSGERYCRQLHETFFGLPLSFRLPSLSELQAVEDHRKLFDFVAEDAYYLSDTKGGFGHWGYKVPEGRMLPEKSSFISAAGLHMRCVATKTIEFKRDVPFDELVRRFTGMLLEVSEASPKILPPHYLKPKKLCKGEFETTQTFQQRVAKENERVRKHNEKLKKAYEETLRSASAEDHGVRPDDIRRQAMQAAFYFKFGAPKFSSVRYDADKGVFHVVIGSQKGNFAYSQTVPVPLKYAKRYKAILSAASPAVSMHAKNGMLKVSSVRQLENPIFLVEKNIFLQLKSIDDYTSFVNDYPDSPFVAEAKMRLAQLKDDRKAMFRTLVASDDIDRMRGFIREYPKTEYSKKLRQRIDALLQEQTRHRREEIAAAQEAERKAYAVRKQRGDLVCRDVGVTFGLVHIEVKGYVEDVSDEKIQIRIVQTYGAEPSIDGVTLRQNTIIWDRYDLWKLCR